MAKDPNHRFASAEELLRAIDALGPPARDPPPSQVHTAENPLVRNLLTPSPLRTPPPVTPRPARAAPPVADGAADSGEVAVVSRAATRDAAAARPAPAAPAAQVPQAAREAGPKSRTALAAAAGALGAAALAGTLWLLKEGRPAPDAALPAAPTVAAPQPVEPAPGPAEAATVKPERTEPARPQPARSGQPRREAARPVPPPEAPAQAPAKATAPAAATVIEWGACRDATLPGAQCAASTDGAAGELIKMPAGYRSGRQHPDGAQVITVLSGRLEVTTSSDSFFFTQTMLSIAAGETRTVPRSFRFLTAHGETVLRVSAAP
jgi:hypothetical protein